MLMGYHERRWLLKTAGRWPWKSESAKECVTTHLPKQLALKMDGALASCLYSTVTGKGAWRRLARDVPAHEAVTSRRVATVCAEALAARPRGAAVGADLGGSSKYTSEALVD
jgi:hypothetical protein